MFFPSLCTSFIGIRYATYPEGKRCANLDAVLGRGASLAGGIAPPPHLPLCGPLCSQSPRGSHEAACLPVNQSSAKTGCGVLSVKRIFGLVHNLYSELRNWLDKPATNVSIVMTVIFTYLFLDKSFEKRALGAPGPEYISKSLR